MAARVDFWLLGAAMLLMAIMPLRSASASPRSDALIDEGLLQLQNGDQQKALSVFKQAAIADPADPEAPFFVGVVLNRMGEGADAGIFLEHSRAIGGANPDLKFELGWSYVQTRKWSAAIAELTAYEKAHPNEKPLAGVFLARAYIPTHELDKAQAALDHAAALAGTDKDLKFEIEFERLRLALARGEKPVLHPASLSPDGIKSAGEYEEIANLLYGPTFRSQLSLSDSLRLSGLPTTAPTRPWWGDLTLGGGFDSAVRNLYASGTLEDETAPEGYSNFIDLNGHAGFMFLNKKDQSAWLDFWALSRTHAKTELRGNFLDSQTTASFLQRMGPSLSAIARVGDEHTWLDADDYRNQYQADGTLAWHICSAVSVQANYAYERVHYNYHNALSPSKNHVVDVGMLVDSFDSLLNRDGDVHTATITAYLTPEKLPFALRAGYYHTWNFSRGSYFDFHDDGVLVGVTVNLPGDLVADLSLTHTIENYKYVYYENGQVSRQDKLYWIRLLVTRKLSGNATAYLSWENNHDASTVKFYGYTQVVLDAGINFSF